MDFMRFMGADNTPEIVNTDNNYTISIIDEFEKEYTADEWNSLAEKSEVKFVKYTDDTLNSDSAILIYAGHKQEWSNHDKYRWANALGHVFTAADANDYGYLGDYYNGYKNCQYLIDTAASVKVADYNSGEPVSNMWKIHHNDGSPISNNIEGLPDKMETWKDYFPGLAAISDIHIEINGKTADAYVPALGQMEKISNHLDEINNILELVGGEIIIKNTKTDGTCIYWCSNEAPTLDGESYYILEEQVKGPYHTVKHAYRQILPLFKIID